MRIFAAVARAPRIRFLLGSTILSAGLLAMPAMSAADPLPFNPSPSLPSPMPDTSAQTWHLDMIHASTAYGRGFTGAGVNVTVADTGVDVYSHALAGKVLLGLSRNYILSSPDEAYDPREITPVGIKDQHGTHVSGIIAARQFSNVAAHGVAYDANIISLRVLLAPDTTAAPAAEIDNAIDAGLNHFTGLTNSMIYNASYGPSMKGMPEQFVWPLNNFAYDPEPYSAFRALQAGKIIVAATGNDREEHPVAGKNPSGLALLPFINPAHANLHVYNDFGQNADFTELQQQAGQIIGVMSVGDNKLPAYYSNYCGVTASWCVAAPGGDMKYNQGVYSTVPYDSYAPLQGTSMAAPVVSGALAVLVQANPGYNAQDLSHLLFSTTEDLGEAGIDAIYGHGLIRLDRATDGPTTLAAGYSATIAADTTTYWSQPLKTDGGFVKDGAGILTISGRTDAAGDVTAALGTLAVDGTLSMSGHRLNVTETATLAGFGTINGDAAIAGTLSPGKMANIGDLVSNHSVPAGTVLTGNSVGTLTFNGNVTLAATATTRIDIDGTLLIPGGPNTYDKIIVCGAGNVFWASGALTPVLRGSVGTVSNYTPAIGTGFMIVQAYNGAQTAGVFTSLVQPVDGMPAKSRFDTVYGSAFIGLAVTPESFSGLASDSGLNAGARTVATMLDTRRVAPGEMPSASDKALFDALYQMPDEAHYARGLNELTGPGQPAVMSAMAQTFQGFMGPIGDRQNAYVLNGSSGMVGTAQAFAMAYDGRIVSAGTSQAFASLDQPAPEQGWTVWGQGFGRWSSVGTSGDFAGSRTQSGGFVMGADRMISADLLAGGAFGFARTTATGAGSSATSDTYAGAAYATWMPGATKFDLRVAAGPSQISTSRQTILMPGAISGATNGVGTAVHFEAGYLIPIWQRAVLQPFAGLGWQGFQRGAYTENQMPFGLAYGSQFYDKLTTTLGLSASAQLRTTDGTTLMPELRIGWGHDLRDTTLVTRAALLDTSLLVEGAQPGRDAGLVGLKLSGWRSENFRLYGSYNGEFRSNAVSHQLAAGARFNW